MGFCGALLLSTVEWVSGSFFSSEMLQSCLVECPFPNAEMMKLDTRLCDVYLNYRRTLGIFHWTGILFEGEYLGVPWEWLQAVATCENIFV